MVLYIDAGSPATILKALRYGEGTGPSFPRKPEGHSAQLSSGLKVHANFLEQAATRFVSMSNQPQPLELQWQRADAHTAT